VIDTTPTGDQIPLFEPHVNGGPPRGRDRMAFPECGRDRMAFPECGRVLRWCRESRTPPPDGGVDPPRSEA